MSLISGCTAYDLILVHNDTNTNDHKKYDASPAQPPLPLTSSSIAASECIFRFGTQYSSSSSFSTGSSYAVYLVVHDGKTGDTLRFPISAYNTIQQDPLFGVDTSSTPTVNNNDHRNSLEKQDQKQRQHDPVALQQLMDALTGANIAGTSTDNPCGPYKANFMLMSTNKNNNDSPADSANATTTKETLLGIAPFRIFIYPCHTTKLGIVDVDGTITTSTLSGFWNTAVLQDYSTRHCHAGVCPFLTQLVTTSTSTSAVEPSTTTGSIQLIYLTNRPITYVDATRNLLNELQDDCYTLPKGPLIGFTGNLAGVFKMDFYHVNAHEFKYNTLEKYVLQPFVDVGATIHQIFHAGFGNTLYDMHAYHRAGIEAHRMFIIDKQSRIHACDASLITSSQNKDETKQKAMTLDHPKQYESMKGTMFATGYLDPNLMTYISNLQY